MIGGTGEIGKAVVNELKQRHEVLIGGSKSGDVRVDMEDPERCVRTVLWPCCAMSSGACVSVHVWDAHMRTYVTLYVWDTQVLPHTPRTRTRVRCQHTSLDTPTPAH